MSIYKSRPKTYFVHEVVIGSINIPETQCKGLLYMRVMGVFKEKENLTSVADVVSPLSFLHLLRLLLFPPHTHPFISQSCIGEQNT